MITLKEKFQISKVETSEISLHSIANLSKISINNSTNLKIKKLSGRKKIIVNCKVSMTIHLTDLTAKLKSNLKKVTPPQLEQASLSAMILRTKKKNNKKASDWTNKPNRHNNNKSLMKDLTNTIWTKAWKSTPIRESSNEGENLWVWKIRRAGVITASLKH